MLKKIFLFLLLTAISCGNALAGGVTNIKEVVNNTPLTIEIRKYDTGALTAGATFETTHEIPANGGTWSGDMWIPWVDSSSDFAEKFLEIKIYRATTFWLWQSGEYIRYNNRARFVDNGRRVPGESKAGGERRLIINMAENRPVFKFEKYR